MKQVALLVAVLIVVATAAAYLTFRHIESAAREPFERSRTDSASQLEKHRSAFLDDLRWFASLPLISRPELNPPLEKDAASFFNEALDWHDHRAAPMRRSPLALPPALVEVLESDQWLTAPLPVVEVDRSWWKRLASFERWSLDRVGPIQEALDGPLVELDPLTLVAPQYLTLRHWVRLHLRFALADPTRSSQVGHDLRHLARLLLTTEDAVASLMVGVFSRNSLEAAQHGDLDALVILSSVDLERFNRVVRASAFLLSPSHAPEYFDLFETMPIGHCFALNELMVAGIYRFQPIMAHAIPEYFENVTSALAAHPECRAAVTRRVWNNRAWLEASMRGKSVFEAGSVADASPAVAAMSSDSDIFTVAQSPQLSRYIAWILLGISGPAPFAGYDDEKKGGSGERL